MSERRKDDSGARRHTGTPARHHAELEAFEREYTIERFTQRDLMLDLGAALWFLTFFAVLVAGQVEPGSDTTLELVLRVVMAIVSAVIGVLMLTLVRRLDDQRTVQVVTGLSVLALLIQFTLSFYGPGALGGMWIAQVAITVYVSQFLSARGVAAMMTLVTVLAGIAVQQNYRADYAPYLLSQTTLLVIILWAVAYSIYALKEDRKLALEEAERAAFSDVLTGLPNTRMLRRRAEALLDSRNERIHRRSGIVLLDLDGFRTANMLRGHRDGDRMLLAVAEAMRQAAPRGQLVARTGSDEFSVLVPNANVGQLEALAARYRSAALEAVDSVAARGVNVDASVGFAISGDGGSTYDELMRTADRSMYLQKAAHERGPVARRRSSTDAEESPRWRADGAQGAPRETRWTKYRWRNRSAQTRFFSIAWLLSGFAVAVSMRMPDAVEHNTTVVDGLVVFALVFSVVRYVTPPSVAFARQMIDVLLASGTLAVAIWFTGKSASPAVPIELLILIFIGWFLPLRAIVPVSILSVVIMLIPTLLGPTNPIMLMDAVTIYGGIAISVALLVVLYYNHFYLERARALTDQLVWLDPRAGAYNRRAFEERMRDELDRLSYGDRDALAVMMIDLGDFKSVSANYGRLIGDQLLSEVAAALAAASREEDCVARLGGDEFAVVAPGVDAESARALAQRLVGAVREALEDTDLPSNEHVRPSAGFALYGMHGRTTEELVTAADVALTAAKTSGRDPNRVSSFVVAL